MLVCLKTEAVSSRAELASRCHRNKVTITRWIHRYKGYGDDPGNLLLSQPVIIARKGFWNEVFL